MFPKKQRHTCYKKRFVGLQLYIYITGYNPGIWSLVKAEDREAASNNFTQKITFLCIMTLGKLHPTAYVSHGGSAQKLIIVSGFHSVRTARG